jgi:hypothetical protein
MLKYRIIGIVFCFIFIYETTGVIERYKIYNKGEFVKVTIFDKNRGGGTLKSYWIDFKYKGKEYSRQIGIASYNKINVNDVIELKHIDGSKFFLLPTENPSVRLLLNSSLLFIGIFFLFYKFKK